MADTGGNQGEPGGEPQQEDRGSVSRSFLGRIGDFVEDRVDDVKDAYDKVDDFVDENRPIIININGIRNAGRDCHNNARETSELCVETVAKAREMVDFGLEIKASLTGMTAGGSSDSNTVVQSSALETIKDLIDGDKMKAAMALAGELDGLALKCVDRSVAMIDAMDEAVDALPDIVENRIENKVEKAAEKGRRDGDPELPDIGPDVEELERCVAAVRDVKLVTAFDAGVNAFNGLTAKGEVCKEMFSAIKDFAVDIVEVSQAIMNFEITKMIGKMRDLAKDIWRCLRLGDLIKAFALAVKKLVNWIISLFKIANEKLSVIWGALSHAKDVMADVIKYIMEAMGLCDEAKNKSDALVDTSREIGGHLKNLDNFDSSTINSIKDLMDGDEIR